MQYIMTLLLLGLLTLLSGEDGYPEDDFGGEDRQEMVLKKDHPVRISVTAQGVAPEYVVSPAQAYVMAKRAATVEAYRIIAERVKGVRIEGQDTIKNMIVKKSVVRAEVSAMIRNAEVVDSTYKNGIFEVEMEIVINYSQFANKLE